MLSNMVRFQDEEITVHDYHIPYAESLKELRMNYNEHLREKQGKKGTKMFFNLPVNRLQLIYSIISSCPGTNVHDHYNEDELLIRSFTQLQIKTLRKGIRSWIQGTILQDLLNESMNQTVNDFVYELIDSLRIEKQSINLSSDPYEWERPDWSLVNSVFQHWMGPEWIVEGLGGDKKGDEKRFVPIVSSDKYWNGFIIHPSDSIRKDPPEKDSPRQTYHRIRFASYYHKGLSEIVGVLDGTYSWAKRDHYDEYDGPSSWESTWIGWTQENGHPPRGFQDDIREYQSAEDLTEKYRSSLSFMSDESSPFMDEHRSTILNNKFYKPSDRGVSRTFLEEIQKNLAESEHPVEPIEVTSTYKYTSRCDSSSARIKTENRQKSGNITILIGENRDVEAIKNEIRNVLGLPDDDNLSETSVTIPERDRQVSYEKMNEEVVLITDPSPSVLMGEGIQQLDVSNYLRELRDYNPYEFKNSSFLIDIVNPENIDDPSFTDPKPIIREWMDRNRHENQFFHGGDWDEHSIKSAIDDLIRQKGLSPLSIKSALIGDSSELSGGNISIKRGEKLYGLWTERLVNKRVVPILVHIDPFKRSFFVFDIENRHPQDDWIHPVEFLEIYRSTLNKESDERNFKKNIRCILQEEKTYANTTLFIRSTQTKRIFEGLQDMNSHGPYEFNDGEAIDDVIRVEYDVEAPFYGLPSDQETIKKIVSTANSPEEIVENNYPFYHIRTDNFTTDYQKRSINANKTRWEADFQFSFRRPRMTAFHIIRNDHRSSKKLMKFTQFLTRMDCIGNDPEKKNNYIRCPFPLHLARKVADDLKSRFETHRKIT